MNRYVRVASFELHGVTTYGDACERARGVLRCIGLDPATTDLEVELEPVARGYVDGTPELWKADVVASRWWRP